MTLTASSMPTVGAAFELPTHPGLPLAPEARQGLVDLVGMGRFVVRLRSGHRWRVLVALVVGGGIERIEPANSIRAIADIVDDLRSATPQLRDRRASEWHKVSRWHGMLADSLLPHVRGRKSLHKQ